MTHPDATIAVPLSRGMFSLIDACDADRVLAHRWYAAPKKTTCYAITTVRTTKRPTTISLHRLIIGAPKGMLVDHINGDGLDNRRCNLRLATHSQNQANRRVVHAASGYKGVFRDKRFGNWFVCIWLNQKPIRIGSFVDPIEAALAYDAKARELYGKFAHTNF